MSFRDYDEYGSEVYDDEYADAKREALMDDYFDKADLRCMDCGQEWWSDPAPATRVDPGYARQPECPFCGGDGEPL